MKIEQKFVIWKAKRRGFFTTAPDLTGSGPYYYYEAAVDIEVVELPESYYKRWSPGSVRFWIGNQLRTIFHNAN